MINVTFVCLGNICRSPMAEFVFKHLVQKYNKKSFKKIQSCGTSGYHDGEDMHIKTKALLIENNIECNNFVSQKIDKKIYDSSDYIFVMDQKNYDYVVDKFENNIKKSKVVKITDYLTNKTIDYVPDPWFTGNFYQVYDIILDCLNNFLKDFD